MRRMLDERLTKLFEVNRSNRVVADCLLRISNGDEVRYRAEGRAPLDDIIDIYSVRERINSKGGGAVEGYEQLLPALRAATVRFVDLHVLEFSSEWYIAFTDVTSTHLIGMLKSAKDEAGWDESAAGYKREAVLPSEGEI